MKELADHLNAIFLTNLGAAPAVATIPANKITAAMLAEGLGIRTLSKSGVAFLVDNKHQMAKYQAKNLETNHIQPCVSLADLREWLSLN